ncbi:hypothetical protein KY290_027270 [Solanum tuberosum]|uniref:Uncharacterized protein n=1 Tax=Solanum tuberosum TaxID=4113 RepID=A0ABQ7UEM0_SOLTU|nr:hypothetical protein KY290_027270 [Solanum tuberosum]
MVQSGCFGEALSVHKERLSWAQKMENRITTLREPPNLSGWDLQNVANRCEFKFMENIIKQVLQEANQTPLDVA